MINLIIATVLTASFFLFFKYFEVFKVNTFQALVVNYFTCIVVGYVFAGSIPVAIFKVHYAWYIYAGVLGFLFISIFFLMAKTAQEVSVAVSSVASKMSMIIPSLLSLFLLEEIRDEFGWVNIVVLLGSLLAIYLVTFEEEKKSIDNKWKAFILVGIVFFGSGLVDTTLNVASIHFPDEYFTQNFTSSELTADQFRKVFPLFCFGTAFLLGSVRVIFLKEKLEWKNVIAGVALGIPNYFSIYFMQAALADFKGNGAFVFPVINIGVILITSALAFILFQERLSKINLLGVCVAISALAILVFV